MVSILGRSIGLWGVLAVVSGAVVLIPSGVALLLALLALVSAFV
jgi:hypothetical protein